MPASAAQGWWRPFGTAGDVALCHVDLSPDAAREASALEWLDREELSRWRGYRHDGARRRFVLCRAALRAELCRRLGCRNQDLAFGANDYGKPFALVGGTPAPISFNVSHSGGHGLIAWAPRGRLGVDVEECVDRHDLQGLIETVLGAEEQAHLAATTGQAKVRLFFRLWTMKEALIKAVGLGLYMDVSRFQVPAALREGVAESGVFQLPEAPGVRWRLQGLEGEDFAAAVAHEVGPYAGG